MRCLTLAKALSEQGAEVYFMCRPHEGHLIDFIINQAYPVFTLNTSDGDNDATVPHASWLGTTQVKDAAQCQVYMMTQPVDWLIVDHYALDQIWQAALRPYYNKLMVIDDLGDRHHLSDLLLDQNYGSTPEKYQTLVPSNTTILTGTPYVLLRPEFSAWRQYSLNRRHSQTLKRLLINLGGGC